MTDTLRSLSQVPSAQEGSWSEFARGWPLLLACALGVGVGLTGLPFYSFGVFLKPLAAEYGWSRSAIASGMLCISSATVFVGPFLGLLIDRIGVRLLATCSLVGLAFGFFLMSRVGPGITSFYLTLLALAWMGAATTPLTWTRAVSFHFVRRRGLALGLMLLGTGMASIIAPPVLQSIIAGHGWRTAYMAIAAFILLCVAPIAWVALGRADRLSATAPAARDGLTLREAIRTRRFWTIVISLLLVTIGQAGTTVHMPALLSDQGLTPAQIATALSLLGVAVVIGRLTVGYLIDMVHAPFVGAIFFALPAATLLLLGQASTPMHAYVAAMLLGLAGGAEVDLLSFFIGRHFGLKAYGACYGFALSFFGIGAGLGPALTGKLYDAAGSYATAIPCGIALFLSGAVLIATLGKSRY